MTGRATRLAPEDETRLLALRRRDVDLRSRIVRVEQSKSGRRRDVPLNAEAVAAIKSLGDGDADRFVFETAKGKPYMNAERDWRLACAAANLRGFRFHDLRHAFASRLVEGGTDLLAVAQLLGHSSLAMVQRYAHLSLQHRREAVERLAQRAGGAALPAAVGDEIGS